MSILSFSEDNSRYQQQIYAPMVSIDEFFENFSSHISIHFQQPRVLRFESQPQLGPTRSLLSVFDTMKDECLSEKRYDIYSGPINNNNNINRKLCNYNQRLPSINALNALEIDSTKETPHSQSQYRTMQTIQEQQTIQLRTLSETNEEPEFVSGRSEEFIPQRQTSDPLRSRFLRKPGAQYTHLLQEKLSFPSSDRRTSFLGIQSTSNRDEQQLTPLNNSRIFTASNLPKKNRSITQTAATSALTSACMSNVSSNSNLLAAAAAAAVSAGNKENFPPPDQSNDLDCVNQIARASLKRRIDGISCKAKLSKADLMKRLYSNFTCFPQNQSGGDDDSNSTTSATTWGQPYPSQTSLFPLSKNPSQQSFYDNTPLLTPLSTNLPVNRISNALEDSVNRNHLNNKIHAFALRKTPAQIQNDFSISSDTLQIPFQQSYSTLNMVSDSLRERKSRPFETIQIPHTMLNSTHDLSIRSPAISLSRQTYVPQSKRQSSPLCTSKLSNKLF